MSAIDGERQRGGGGAAKSSPQEDAEGDGDITVGSSAEEQEFGSVVSMQNESVQETNNKEAEKQEMSFDEKFEFVKGRAYATDVSMQSYDATTGIIVKDSKAFNCIGLVTYLYDIRADYDVAHFDMYSQFIRLTDIKSISDLKPGDIIRWCGSNADGVNNHVQIWRGNDVTWESCHDKGVSIRTNYSTYENWYKKSYPDYQITFYRKR